MIRLLAASLLSGEYWIIKLLTIPGMVLFFSFRGFFQAWVAKKLGDTLPERNGFLTMNPRAHINLIGFIMLVLVGFGFGKPIQFDSRCYKHPKRDAAIQVLSAPAAGIIMAFAMYTVVFILDIVALKTGVSNVVFDVVRSIFFYAFDIALWLTVFLFLPLPGFDLYRLIVIFLPYNIYRKLYVLEKYSLWIYIGFILLLRVPVIGDFLYTYLLGYPTSALSWLITKPFELLKTLFV